MYFVVFFFKQKTAYEMRISDWSSDVCSSDLGRPRPGREVVPEWARGTRRIGMIASGQGTLDAKGATQLAILGVVCRAPALGTEIVALVKHIVGDRKSVV